MQADRASGWWQGNREEHPRPGVSPSTVARAARVDRRGRRRWSMSSIFVSTLAVAGGDGEEETVERKQRPKLKGGVAAAGAAAALALFGCGDVVDEPTQRRVDAQRAP